MGVAIHAARAPDKIGGSVEPVRHRLTGAWLVDEAQALRMLCHAAFVGDALAAEISQIDFFQAIVYRGLGVVADFERVGGGLDPAEPRGSHAAYRILGFPLQNRLRLLETKFGQVTEAPGEVIVLPWRRAADLERASAGAVVYA
ncbi:hypothetical protein IFT74_19985 [Oxalobacteraceae sp. CFBP 8755]|nr:hypothetical protein [Oxalobacteraceae sp. CFBP 8755]